MRLLRVLISMLLAGGGILLSTMPATACSQCMCGTPFPSDLLGGVVPMQFAYGVEERYLSKENALDEGPGSEKEREHRIAGFALWRPMDRLALLARLPYNFKEIQAHPQGENQTVETSRGLGDAEFLVLVGLLHKPGSTPVMLGLVLGAIAPTGSSDAKNDQGERLDAHLQPGSGAWSGTAGLHLAVSTGRGVWDASVLGRTSAENAHGYRYGNTVLYNAGFTSKAWRGLQLLAQINGRVAERDRFEDTTLGVNTGSTVTYASPGLRWNTGMGLALEGALQVPVAQDLYGDQTEHTTGRLTLSMSR